MSSIEKRPDTSSPTPAAGVSWAKAETSSVSSRNEAKSLVPRNLIPRNLLPPVEGSWPTRFEQIAPGHQVRVTNRELGGADQISQYAAVADAAGLGDGSLLREETVGRMKDPMIRAYFGPGMGGAEAYDAYLKQFEGRSRLCMWGDQRTLRVLHDVAGKPIVVASRDEAGQVHVDWVDDSDRQLFEEKGESAWKDGVVGLWREGSEPCYEVMY